MSTANDMPVDEIIEHLDRLSELHGPAEKARYLAALRDSDVRVAGAVVDIFRRDEEPDLLDMMQADKLFPQLLQMSDKATRNEDLEDLVRYSPLTAVIILRCYAEVLDEMMLWTD